MAHKSKTTHLRLCIVEGYFYHQLRWLCSVVVLLMVVMPTPNVCHASIKQWVSKDTLCVVRLKKQEVD